MNELQIFKNSQFGEIRTIEIYGKPYFVASDVAKALGYARPNDAVLAHCRYTVKHSIPHPQSTTKTLEVNMIPQGDVVRLAVKSELPGADKFESWIFDEVIPDVLNHGMYAAEELINNPDLLIAVATELKEEREKSKRLEYKIEQDKPKTVFADAVTASKSSILIGELAKIIKQNGVNIGQNRLFEWLRNSGYLISRKGNDYNMPTQRSMELGLFEIKETAITHADGHTTITKTPKVTGKGQQYFINKFLAA